MVKIYVTVKQAGKRRGYITNQEIVLDPTPSSLCELITQIVRINVDAYNRRVTGEQLLQYLLPEGMEDQVATGKIGFDQLANTEQSDVNRAIATAILAFEDGIFRVFSDENEVTELDAPLELTDGAVFTFIRFTMLAGRMW